MEWQELKNNVAQTPAAKTIGEFTFAKPCRESILILTNLYSKIYLAITRLHHTARQLAKWLNKFVLRAHRTASKFPCINSRCFFGRDNPSKTIKSEGPGWQTWCTGSRQRRATVEMEPRRRRKVRKRRENTCEWDPRWKGSLKF